MPVLAAPIGMILFVVVCVAAVRMTGSHGALRSARFWYVTLAAPIWIGLLFLVSPTASLGIGHPALVLLEASVVVAWALARVFGSALAAFAAALAAWATMVMVVTGIAWARADYHGLAFAPVDALLAALFWNAGLAAALLPIAWRVRRINHRSANRECVHCGYSLVSVLRSPLCPECGEPFRGPREGDLPAPTSDP